MLDDSQTKDLKDALEKVLHHLERTIQLQFRAIGDEIDKLHVDRLTPTEQSEKENP